MRLEAHTIFGFLGVKMVEKWLRVFTCGFIAKNIPIRACIVTEFPGIDCLNSTSIEQMEVL